MLPLASPFLKFLIARTRTAAKWSDVARRAKCAKQTAFYCRRRQRLHHLKMYPRVPAFSSRLPQAIYLPDALLLLRNLIGMSDFWDKKRLKISPEVLTSTIELQNRSFHFVERTKVASKCRSKACKTAVYYFQICKFVTCLSSSLTWLLELPNDEYHLTSRIVI